MVRMEEEVLGKERQGMGASLRWRPLPRGPGEAVSRLPPGGARRKPDGGEERGKARGVRSGLGCSGLQSDPGMKADQGSRRRPGRAGIHSPPV